MKILKKGICFTGEVLGISTETLFRLSGVGINSLYKKMESGNDKDIEKIAKNLGERVSNVIIKESKNIAKDADRLTENLIDKTKYIASQAFVKEIRVYGNTEYIYDNKDLVNGEFEVYE